MSIEGDFEKGAVTVGGQLSSSSSGRVCSERAAEVGSAALAAIAGSEEEDVVELDQRVVDRLVVFHEALVKLYGMAEGIERSKINIRSRASVVLKPYTDLEVVRHMRMLKDSLNLFKFAVRDWFQVVSQALKGMPSEMMLNFSEVRLKNVESLFLALSELPEYRRYVDNIDDLDADLAGNCVYLAKDMVSKVREVLEILEIVRVQVPDELELLY